MQRILLSIVALSVFAISPLAADEISVTVSPNVINIASQSEVVTVHTDIAYSAVTGASVTLNGIPIDFWKSDNRGYFVAKFDAVAVKGIVEAGTTATLTLNGTRKLDGSEFSGSDSVRIIKVKKNK
jgi:hypothetical protein